MAKKKKEVKRKVLDLSDFSQVARIYVKEAFPGDDVLIWVDQVWLVWDGEVYEETHSKVFRGKLRRWVESHDLFKIKKQKQVSVSCTMIIISEILDSLKASALRRINDDGEFCQFEV